jgi:hypothetical protein
MKRFRLSQPNAGTEFVIYSIPDVSLKCLKCNSTFRVISPLAITSTLPVEFMTCDGEILPVVANGAAVTGSDILANNWYLAVLAPVPSGYQVQLLNA